MRRKLFTTQSDYNWLLDELGFEWIFQALEHRSEEDQALFDQLCYQRMLAATSPIELAQKVLGATSPVDAAFKLLRTSSERRECMRRLKEEENLLVE